jgi:flavorubredoxin
MLETKQRDVQVLPIGTETTVLRSRTWDRLKFEIEYAFNEAPQLILI